MYVVCIDDLNLVLVEIWYVFYLINDVFFSGMGFYFFEGFLFVYFVLLWVIVKVCFVLFVLLICVDRMFIVFLNFGYLLFLFVYILFFFKIF